MTSAESTTELEPDQATDEQRAVRRLMQELLALGANFLAHVAYLDSRSKSPGDPDGNDFNRLSTDYRNTAVYYYRLQSVWDELFTALKRVGNVVTFCNPRDFPLEAEISLILDKQVVLEQFVENRLTAMLEAAPEEQRPELSDALESVSSRLAELEERQEKWPQAPYRPTMWDLEADRIWHDTMFGWPYQDRADPEPVEE